MIRRSLFALAVGALIASPAPSFATDWQKGCQSGSIWVTLGLGGTGNFSCYDPTSSSDDSPIIDFTACENVDWELFDDKDGDGTVCTVAWEVERCPEPNGVLSAAAEDLACEIQPGTAALSGDDSHANLIGGWNRVKGDGLGANATSCRIKAKCALGSQ